MCTRRKTQLVEQGDQAIQMKHVGTCLYVVGCDVIW